MKEIVISNTLYIYKKELELQKLNSIVFLKKAQGLRKIFFF